MVDIARDRRRRRSTRLSSCPRPTATSTSSTASSSTWRARSTTAVTAHCSTRCSPTARCARRGAGRRARRAGHHAYLGGLLEHTVAVATLAHEICQLHPRLNSDLLLSAAIDHDLGTHARVHLRRRDRADRRGPPARPRRRSVQRMLVRALRGRPRRGAAAGAAALRAVPPRPHRGARRTVRLGRGARAVPAQRAGRRRQGRAGARAARVRAPEIRRPPRSSRPKPAPFPTRVGSPSARQGPGGPSGLQNRQGGAALRLEGSIPSPRRGSKCQVSGRVWRIDVCPPDQPLHAVSLGWGDGSWPDRAGFMRRCR